MAITDRILVPTDFSNYSENACLFANKLAAATGGVVDLLHVIPDSGKPAGGSGTSAEAVEDVRDENYPHIFEKAELKLKSLSKDYFQQENRGSNYVKADRSPAHAIAEQAQDSNYSLIVMSAIGKNEAEWFRDSITEEVLRTSKIPVFSVSDNAENLEGGRIIIPVDGSLLSMAATPAAALLATIFNATITYLYVHDRLGLFSKSVPDKQDDRQSRRTAEYLMDQLMDFLDVAKPHGLHVIDSEPAGLIALLFNNQEVSISFEVQDGLSAHHEITSFANQFTSMVVMTTHGRSGLAHILMGSNAEKVVVNTQKTILTIRPDSKLFKTTN